MNTTSIQSLQQRQASLKILVFSLVTIMIWVGYSIFSSQQQTGISPELQALAQPLNPNIHLEVVDQIQLKRTFSASELQSFPILRVVRREGANDVITTNVAPPVTAPAQQ